MIFLFYRALTKKKKKKKNIQKKYKETNHQIIVKSARISMSPQGNKFTFSG